MRKFTDRTLQDQKEEKNIRNAVITMVFFAIMDRALKILLFIMKNYISKIFRIEVTSKIFYDLNSYFIFTKNVIRPFFGRIRASELSWVEKIRFPTRNNKENK